MTVLLAVLALALFGWLAFYLILPPQCSMDRAVLHLTIEDTTMKQIGQTVLGAIAPTNDDSPAGSAPVFGVLWEIENAVLYSAQPAPDGLTCTFTAIASGIGAMVRVTATTKSGVVLSEVAGLPEVSAPSVDEEAVALNLTITE